MTKRREFLAVVGASVAAVGLFPSLLMAGKKKSRRDPYSADTYRSLLNTPFYARDTDWNIYDLQLVDVKDGPETAMADQFTLVFTGLPSVGMATGLYTVSHRRVGQYMLYLELTDDDGSIRHYRSDFSLLK